ncbi:spore germination protein [Neobacillus pocheonensis]|uniref:spore germination protein n=1 Tax=Neobacillus pocheonensis TaxID=363869 RepID=UPI003D2D0D9E
MKWRKLKNNQLNAKKPEKSPLHNDHLTHPSIHEMTGNITVDMDVIRNEIGHNSDVRFREFRMGETDIRVALVFIEGLADMDLLHNHILVDLMSVSPIVTDPSFDNSSLKDFIKNHALTVCGLTEVCSLKEITSGVMFGSIAILVEGLNNVFLVGEAQAKTRNIDEPPTEALVRGPRVGFIENLRDNTALLRRHGKDQNLSIISFQIGERSKKELVITYMKDIVDPLLLEEVKQRINKIKMDDVHDSSYIEQLIEDNFLSPFPQVQSTERPDRVMSALMEGRVSILLDGSPFALIVPVTFNMLLQSPEDYYERWIAASLIRILRYFAAFIALFVPSLYIAFISFHPGLIPTKLVFSVAANREGVPFPPLIEALIMEVSIEVLREAGLRLPKPIGQSLGIVGGLIIGEAAVQAGIVSPIMVIVVAVTAISSFALPQYNVGIALRMLRFASMLFASVFGLYGVILFFLLLGSHLVRLKSFGIPYISPAVSYRLRDWKDFIIRVPLFLMKRRPQLLHSKDTVRKR